MIPGKTGSEYINGSSGDANIMGLFVNIKNKSQLMRRLDVIISAHEKTDKYDQIDERLNKLYAEVREYLPKEKYNLILEIDDCFTEFLISCEEHFYRYGYKDGKIQVSLWARILSWFRGT